MSEHVVTIPGRFPGMNEYTAAQRANVHQGAAMKRNAQDLAVLCIKTQLHGLRIEQPVKLHYTFYEINRKRDLDNVAGFGHKVIQDALVQAGVLKNDGWKNVCGFSDDFEVDAKHPRIVVRIEEKGE